MIMFLQSFLLPNVSVTVGTSDGTAVAGSNYVAKTETLVCIYSSSQVYLNAKITHICLIWYFYDKIEICW